MIVVSPRAAALRIIAARQADTLDAGSSSVYTLAAFQEEAVARAHAILLARGGVLIADSVGLGKTFIGAALIERYLEPDGTVAVVAPASLKPLWRRALQPIRDQWPDRVHVITHGQLSRGLEVGRSFALIVVDEAHGFRNPATRRYRALRRLVRAAPVALLTATPVNNSLSDLYFQLRICVADDAFRDLGIGSLAALLRDGPPDPDALARLRHAFIVRRTRAELRRRFPEIELPTGERLRFPGSVRLVNIRHPPPISVTKFEELLDRLTFAAYPGDTAGPLISIGLLKRIQSSRFAALASLDRLIAFHHRFRHALGQGRWLRPRALPDGDQLSFTELVLERPPAAMDVTRISASVSIDAQVLQQLRALVDDSPDVRVHALREILTARPPPARTVVFTEFRDTAEHLWRELRGQFRVGLITGSHACLGEGRASRQQVIRRFAPAANHAPEPNAAEAVFVLIATDVLAEGLNLQDADAVVSYDLPWNPVRLIQRAGRIDRIGSRHDGVTVYNFMPDREFDELLGLVRKLRAKLQDVRLTIGQEAPVLESDEIPPSFFEDMAAGRAEALQYRTPPDDHLHPNLDLSTAAPLGAAGCTCLTARRVLVSWRGAGALREFVVADGVAVESRSAANDILERALPCDTLSPLSDELFAAVELSRGKLRNDCTPSDRQNGVLATAVQRAVERHGIMAPPALVEEADRLLAALRTNVYEPGQLHLVRRARTPDELSAALRRLRESCRDSAEEGHIKWELVAAVAVESTVAGREV